MSIFRLNINPFYALNIYTKTSIMLLLGDFMFEVASVFAKLLGFQSEQVSKREEFNKEIEKNLKFMTKAGHLVQSEGERIIADRLYECGIDYIYDSLIEINGEWIRPDFILPGLNDLIIEYKGMEDPEYNEKFERKLMILAAVGMRLMILRQRDLGRVREIIVSS